MTRSTLTDTANATAAISAATSAGEDGGADTHQLARLAAWERRVAATDATVAAFSATIADPLPPLPVVRLVLSDTLNGDGEAVRRHAGW